MSDSLLAAGCASATLIFTLVLIFLPAHVKYLEDWIVVCGDLNADFDEVPVEAIRRRSKIRVTRAGKACHAVL
ncbi:hypothetical protein EO95_08895 [Methanosarcina sp. 1.H.T.1A.1]|uniref:hypothetical protein n=1 Tax=Methanosarcina sp. 1.H.T.1A.1 TaxID=1483602 RepID=UPI00062238B1|nr:hypothetical protein [Methanosarcina sp. 1.H.T.1A.1]KKH95434.1 hypothetical protein EO95_08895 [Methanosarcina sp. 1.H.T.1A.1]